MEVLLGEAGIPLVHHSPFQQFAALIVAQNLPLDSFLPTFLAERHPDFTQGEWTTIMDRASGTGSDVGARRAKSSRSTWGVVRQAFLSLGRLSRSSRSC